MKLSPVAEAQTRFAGLAEGVVEEHGLRQRWSPNVEAALKWNGPGDDDGHQPEK